MHRAEQVLRRDAAEVGILLEHLRAGRHVALAAAHALRDDARDDEQES